MPSARVHPCEPLQCGPARRKGRTVRVEEPEPERRECPRAPIIGGAAAEPEDEPFATSLQRRAHQLAGAGGGGAPGVSLTRCEQAQPGGRGHLDDGRAPRVQQPVGGSHGSAERPLDGARHPLSTQAREQRVHRARPAVRERRHVQLHTGRALAQPLGQRGGGLGGREGALELLRCDEPAAHGVGSAVRSSVEGAGVSRGTSVRSLEARGTSVRGSEDRDAEAGGSGGLTMMSPLYGFRATHW